MLVVVLVLTCFFQVPVSAAKSKQKQYTKFTVSKVRKTKSSVKVTAKFINNTDNKEIWYGNGYFLQKKVGKKWVNVEWKEGIAWTDEVYNLPAGGRVKKIYTIPRDYVNTKFKKGKTYRLVINVIIGSDDSETSQNVTQYLKFKIK